MMLRNAEEDVHCFLCGNLVGRIFRVGVDTKVYPKYGEYNIHCLKCMETPEQRKIREQHDKEEEERYKKW
jgi:hypothetical protein